MGKCCGWSGLEVRIILIEYKWQIISITFRIGLTLWLLHKAGYTNGID